MAAHHGMAKKRNERKLMAKATKMKRASPKYRASRRASRSFGAALYDAKNNGISIIKQLKPENIEEISAYRQRRNDGENVAKMARIAPLMARNISVSVVFWTAATAGVPFGVLRRAARRLHE